jgi:hypothetical protein
VRGIIDSREQLVITYGRHQMTIEKVVRKTTLDAQGNDFFYWQTQPYELRLAALEQKGKNSTFGNMVLNPNFKEFLRSLNDKPIFDDILKTALVIYGIKNC